MFKGLKNTAKAVAAGGVAGGSLYTVVGGVGVTLAGGAAGITLLPMIAIGAGLGAAGYGLYRLGQISVEKRPEK